MHSCSAPDLWHYQRFGTVSHTGLRALAPSATSQYDDTVTPGRTGKPGLDLVSRSQYKHLAAGPSSSSSQLTGDRRAWRGGGPICGQWRTGRTCFPAGLSSLGRPSVLLRSAWRKLSTMERPKFYSLVGLVVQSSVLALTMRYSRTSQDKEHRYSTSTAVVISELMKVIICIFAIAFTARKTLLSQLAMLSNTRELVKCSLPAMLYTIQNNLLFVAVTYLDAATFQVTYQLKILSTAIFSVCFLRRQLDIIHWSALVMLTCGVGLVQLPGAVSCNSDTPGDCDTSTTRGRQHDMFLGLTSVLAMCVTSGFAGVYTEKILKTAGPSGSMWLKNTRLSLSSVIVSLVYVYSVEGTSIQERGFLYGYELVTWLVVLQQATLGLLTALVMKYADNIIKGFASSIAIVISTFVSSIILNDLQLSCSFLIGASVVMGSALLYNVDRTASEAKSLDTVV